MSVAADVSVAVTDTSVVVYESFRVTANRFALVVTTVVPCFVGTELRPRALAGIGLATRDTREPIGYGQAHAIATSVRSPLA